MALQQSKDFVINFEEYSSCVIDVFVQRGIAEVAHGAFHQDFCTRTVGVTGVYTTQA